VQSQMLEKFSRPNGASSGFEVTSQFFIVASGAFPDRLPDRIADDGTGHVN
jgi:hypothetical protein